MIICAKYMSGIFVWEKKEEEKRKTKSKDI
jgi:hypothetical protein